MPRRQAKEIALNKLAAVGLEAPVGELFPAELSGGMQKRVALARAIAKEPAVIFFDEPTTGLDPIMSDVINKLIVKCVRDLGATAVSITHDMVRPSPYRRPHRHDPMRGASSGTVPLRTSTGSGNPYVDQFIHGRAEGPISMPVRGRCNWRRARPATSANPAAPAIRAGAGAAMPAASGTPSSRSWWRRARPRGFFGRPRPQDRSPAPGRQERTGGAAPKRGSPSSTGWWAAGLVKGSALLIGGDPGIGKSTLVLQVAAALGRFAGAAGTIYISGEEAIEQVRLRARRLGLSQAPVLLAAATSVRDIASTLDAGQPPELAIIDSIQTMYVDNLDSAPGTVAQVRASAAELISSRQAPGFSLLLVGHSHQGGHDRRPPGCSQHMVDTVLYFEGERGHQFRILRAVKNRFGPANEIGVFEMTDAGLMEVPNPSALFLAERHSEVSGATVFAGMEGSRPLLVEIQALLSPSLPGTPRRAVVGWDKPAGLAMVLAVLETRCGSCPRRIRCVSERRWGFASRRAGGRSGGSGGSDLLAAGPSDARRHGCIRRGSAWVERSGPSARSTSA